MKKNREKAHFNRDVKSPNISFNPHLRVQEFGAVGKMLFEHFLKAIEMISERLFPEEPLERSVPKTIENYFLQLEHQLFTENNERAIGEHHKEMLMQLLSNQRIVINKFSSHNIII